MDYILYMGDAIYNAIGLIGESLDVDRLPHTVLFEGLNIPVRKTHLTTGLFRVAGSENFL